MSSLEDSLTAVLESISEDKLYDVLSSLSEKTLSSVICIVKKVENHAREDLYVILRTGKEKYEYKISSAMVAFLKLHELKLPKDWKSQPLFVALYLVLPNDVNEETFKVCKIAKGERIEYINREYYTESDEEYEYCDYDGRSHRNEWYSEYESQRTYSECISPKIAGHSVDITRRPTPIPENFLELVTEFAKTFPCTLNLERLKKFLPSEGPYSIPTN